MLVLRPKTQRLIVKGAKSNENWFVIITFFNLHGSKVTLKRQGAMAP